MGLYDAPPRVNPTLRGQSPVNGWVDAAAQQIPALQPPVQTAIPAVPATPGAGPATPAVPPIDRRAAIQDWRALRPQLDRTALAAPDANRQALMDAYRQQRMDWRDQRPRFAPIRGNSGIANTRWPGAKPFNVPGSNI